MAQLTVPHNFSSSRRDSARRDMGATPLHVAIAQQNLDMIRSLLQAGARDDIRSEFGLHRAKRQIAAVAQLPRSLVRNDIYIRFERTRRKRDRVCIHRCLIGCCAGHRGAPLNMAVELNRFAVEG